MIFLGANLNLILLGLASCSSLEPKLQNVSSPKASWREYKYPHYPHSVWIWWNISNFAGYNRNIWISIYFYVQYILAHKSHTHQVGYVESTFVKGWIFLQKSHRLERATFSRNPLGSQERFDPTIDETIRMVYTRLQTPVTIFFFPRLPSGLHDYKQVNHEI